MTAGRGMSLAGMRRSLLCHVDATGITAFVVVVYTDAATTRIEGIENGNDMYNAQILCVGLKLGSQSRYRHVVVATALMIVVVR